MGNIVRRPSHEITTITMEQATQEIATLQDRVATLERVVTGLAQIVNQLDIALTEDVDAKHSGSIWGS